MPPEIDMMKARRKPFATRKYLLTTPLMIKATRSDRAKQREFSKMLPGKYFMKKVSMKKLNELIAQVMMLPTKFWRNSLLCHISR